MPGMSGQELALAARARCPGLRVVFMSGHTEDVIVREGAREGALAFVQKPFTRNSLLRAIEGAARASAAVRGRRPAAEGEARRRRARARARRRP